MKKEELAQILSRDGIVPDLGDIEDHLAVIATDISLPRFEIGMCTARMEEAGPHLRALLARAVQGEELAEEEKMLAFRGLHILGAARDTESFPLLMRLLRRPEDEIDDLLGDTVTISLARIAAGMFDGDSDTLLSLILDRSVPDTITASLLGAAAFLTWEGRIERDKMRGLLTRFYDECQAEDDDLAWYDWQRAIALLGLRDLAPLFERASKEGRISNYLITRSEFEGDLARAEQAPTDIERFKEAHLGYIEDVVESLEWSDRLDEDDLLEEFEEEEPPPRIANFNTPEINPFRHVGRNDPCPCGSGKKTKKCCLAT